QSSSPLLYCQLAPLILLIRLIYHYLLVWDPLLSRDGLPNRDLKLIESPVTTRDRANFRAKLPHLNFRELKHFRCKSFGFICGENCRIPFRRAFLLTWGTLGL